jgi:hypothetical protein
MLRPRKTTIGLVFQSLQAVASYFKNEEYTLEVEIISVAAIGGDAFPLSDLDID